MSDEIGIRSFRVRDVDETMALAPRLAKGLAPWRSVDAARAATRGWLAASTSHAADDGHAVFVAVHRGAVVGVVSIQERSHWTGELDGCVGELVTARGHEGRGVGTELMRAAGGWATHGGLHCLTLEVGAANLRARELYAGLGFRSEELRLTRVLRPSSA